LAKVTGPGGPTTTKRMTVHLVVEAPALRLSKSPEEPPGWVLLGTHRRFGITSTHSAPLVRRILSLSTHYSTDLRPGSRDSRQAMNFFGQYQAAVLRAVCRHTGEQKGDVWYRGSITLVFFSTLRRTKMDRLLNKKSKKSPKYSQRNIFPGILTNTAVGPLGFRTQFDVAPKGEQNRFY